MERKGDGERERDTKKETLKDRERAKKKTSNLIVFEEELLEKDASKGEEDDLETRGGGSSVSFMKSEGEGG